MFSPAIAAALRHDAIAGPHPLSKVVVSLRAAIHAMLIALEMTRVTRASEMRDSATIRARPTA
jgi:hypothetical protein